MRTGAVLSLALAFGCVSEEAVQAPGQLPPADVLLTTDGLDVDALSRVDVRGTATSMAILAEKVEALSPEARADAAESLQLLSVSCPYTRAALTLPYALHASVMRIDAVHLNSFVQSDWIYLQQGLSTHVAVLDALSVDLVLPSTDDPLHTDVAGLMVDRQTLQTSANPVEAASPLVHELVTLAEAVDASTMERIDLHSDRVEEATGIGRPCPRSPFSVLPGQPWNLGMQIGGWHDALKRIEPFVEDAETQAQVGAMIALVDAYTAANETYRYDVD
ncbi:MAG: hypothetical protein KC912_10025 [Proteobacteria bacterium]|nr:hypothetical protein [Pseudomonadota bacterium]